MPERCTLNRTMPCNDCEFGDTMDSIYRMMSRPDLPPEKIEELVMGGTMLEQTLKSLVIRNLAISLRFANSCERYKK